MRNRLATAALVALLGLIADGRPSAEPARTERSAQQAPARPGVRSIDTSERARTATRRSGHAHSKRHVVRSPPNQRKIAEKHGYKRVSDLVNFPSFFPGLGIVFVKPDTL